MAENLEVDKVKNSKRDTLLSLLLAMAMFVLVVDTAIMNVSISTIVADLGW